MLRPVVALAVQPAPLVAVQDPSGSAYRYRVYVVIDVRETAGAPARVRRLFVTVSAPSGWSTTSIHEVDLDVPARESRAHNLTSIFDVGGPDPSATWRLRAEADEPDGVVLSSASVDVPLSIPPAPVADAVLVGAGDMAECGRQETELTARLVDGIPGSVFVAGDLVYPYGSSTNYAQCFDPTWGRHKWRMFPAPGNHDWQVDGGAAYYGYFGLFAGPSGDGYYHWHLGAWHLLTLNSNIPAGPGSRQYEWVKQNLEAHQTPCMLAMWHHPVFSSGQNGNSRVMRDIWRLMHQFGVDVVLTGHDHTYERFAPQDGDGRPDPRGIREFVVGTGGYSLYALGRREPNSEVFENRTWGVLKLTLKSTSYDWEFVPIPGQSFRDFGSAPCSPLGGH